MKTPLKLLPTLANGEVTKTAFAIAAYATCSSLMLIINKLTVTFLPAPSLVLFAQLLFAALSIRGMTEAGIVNAEPLQVHKAKPFVLVSAAFLSALYTNVKCLQYANVETFIVFRSSTPCIIALLDFYFLGRELPNAKSWASLTAIVSGAVAYVLSDSDFEVRAYGWVLAWYFVFSVDQIYIKYAVDNSNLSVWGRTYYTNALAVGPVLIIGLATGETAVLTELRGWNSAVALAASCVAGVMMSYSAFMLRGMISATSFTVIGTMCKISTVVINCLMWDKHASFWGLVALFVCLFAGLAYEQAPLRENKDGLVKQQTSVN